MPTVQGTDDFDHAIDAGFYTDSFFSSGGFPAAVTSPLYASQAKSLQITTDGNNIGARHNLTGTPGRGWAAFAYQVAALPTSGIDICSFTSTGGTIGAVSLGTVGLFAGVSGNLGAETAISSGTWYWVEAIFDATGTTHTLYLRIEGTDAASASASGTAGTVQWHQLISFAGNESGRTSYYSLWKWGSAASTTDWLGEPAEGPAPTLYRSQGMRW